MNRRGPGPHVAWTGVVVKMTDGTTHAFEFHADASNFVTADIILSGKPPRQNIIVKLEGVGTWWTEGADLTRDQTKPYELAAGLPAIEGEVL
jgi:hypothetical protein